VAVSSWAEETRLEWACISSGFHSFDFVGAGCEVNKQFSGIFEIFRQTSSWIERGRVDSNILTRTSLFEDFSNSKTLQKDLLNNYSIERLFGVNNISEIFRTTILKVERVGR
jgi:DNA-binding XRE family transcriptional regulator